MINIMQCITEIAKINKIKIKHGYRTIATCKLWSLLFFLLKYPFIMDLTYLLFTMLCLELNYFLNPFSLF